MKQLIFLIAVIIIIAALPTTHLERDTDGVIREYSNDTVSHTYETDDTHYYSGEILYPDYVQQDTLIVINADDLNNLMETYDAACDGDIADILRVTTVKYSKGLEKALKR